MRIVESHAAEPARSHGFSWAGRRSRLLAILLLLAFLLPGSPGPGTRARLVSTTAPAPCALAGISPGSGIMWESDADLKRDLDEITAIGAQWIRLDFGWTNIEPVQGTFDWSNTDRVLNAVVSRGLKVVAILHATPAWARPAGTDNIFYPPTDPATFASFANRTVSRYSTKVKTWEVLNEPNISRFWQPKPDPAGYTALLKLAYAAIKKADPAATVVSAGLSPAVDATDGSQIAPATYLKRIYESGGQGFFDAVGIHPYSFPARPIDPSTSAWNTFHRTFLLYDLMLRNGDGDKKVWFTEFGAATGTGLSAVSEPEQAAIVTDSFRAMGQLPFVGGPMFIYSNRDAGTNPADIEDNFGLMRRDFSAKAARAAYVNAATACQTLQPATLAVSDATVVEGTSGTTVANLTIRRGGDASGTVSVRYATVEGTATPDNDYVAVGLTTVNFAAGETSKTVAVSVKGDTAAEANETFSVKLSSPTGATLSDDTGLGTIMNDDAFPTLSINDVAIPEGNTGTTTATFTITRAGVTASPSSVQYATVAGSATAGTDYVAVGPVTATFAVGETSKTVAISVKPDTVLEPDETFSVKLSSPTGGAIGDDTGLGTILNDDTVGTFLSVNDISVGEGGLANATATFTVTRSGDVAGSSSVQYATANGTATAGSDFTGAGPAAVTFASGEATKTVSITILTDLSTEGNETVLLNLSSPTGATINDGQGVATIVDDDLLLGLLATPGPATFVAVADTVAIEGNSGTTTATFIVTRTGLATGASSVQYATAAGTAAAAGDFVGVSPTTLNFAPLELVKTVTVNVVGDTSIEPTESFSVKLSSASGTTIADDTGVATIFDDDVLPGVAISDASTTEGNAGPTTVTFTISRSGITALPSSVQYATGAGTAAAGSDFVGAGPTTVNFGSGETTKTFTVAVVNDTVHEGAETFSVKLSSPIAAVLSDDTGTGTIFDDDPLPTVAVSDIVTPSGDADSWAIFSVTRAGNTTGTSSVKYATAEGTATEGTAYVGISPTTLTFAPDERFKIVTVRVKAHDVKPDESFSLNLSSPTGVAVADASGAADVVPAPSAGGARFNPVSPARILDTREGNGAPAAPLGPGGVLDLQVTGRGGVPASGVSAVVLNVTVTQPTAHSVLTAFPTGQTLPLASNLNFDAGQTVPNLVVVKVGTGGKVGLYNAFGTVHVIADVAGWYDDGTASTGARFNPVSPARILDTREGNGAPAAPLGPGGVLDLQVTGRGGVPASGVSAVVLNVTVTQPTAHSVLTAFPTGQTLPLASNLNFDAGQTVPNLVVVKVGTGGKVGLYNAFGTVHVIADVAGWYDAA